MRTSLARLRLQKATETLTCIATGVFLGSIACYILRDDWRAQILSGAAPGKTSTRALDTTDISLSFCTFVGRTSILRVGQSLVVVMFSAQ